MLAPAPTSLETLHFTNRLASLPERYYTRLRPEPFPRQQLLAVSDAALELLDLPPTEATRPEFAEVFSGKRALKGSDPLATIYAGHQFGTYVPQLGDGRALTLGEIHNSRGEYWEVQLKGSGRTPYSRFADGRAVLRSSIREFLASEHLHALGIPTTRALCLIATGETVLRETAEPGAVITRLSPSFLRFGHFEYFFYTGQEEALRELADFTITHYFPECGTGADRYVLWYEAIAKRTARLMAQWQIFGFAHGVMNTDNMSILGLTIDYGPYGFLDAYEPGFICNHSDHTGRYAFERQPQIALWNLTALGMALSPLLATEDARYVLQGYQPELIAIYAALARKKLGLNTEDPDDPHLWADLLQLMEMGAVDYTNLFRALGTFSTMGDNATIAALFPNAYNFSQWAERYKARLLAEQSDDTVRKSRVNQANPKYILRNYLAETAIRKAYNEQDYSEINTLLNILTRPYDEQPGYEAYAATPPEWAGDICISCSS